MSKGLEAYKIVKEECGFAFGGTANGDRVRKNLSIIEKELEDYDLLKRSLNRNWIEVVNDEKKLKALEIIKEKNVDVRLLVSYTKEKPNDEWALAEYNAHCKSIQACKFYECRDYLIPKQLTQEEYDLLKEVLL